ncbi:hypothetical protein [Paenibacillus alvei]|uniref:hypothetical protein n=1 Tax=Paenibacillus alvei TaxID=44250 RepID=UPI0018CE3D5F|nr:hypothetical protein [Paenibacillus alvei]MBG9736803.1 hypothetical protein [Paenibacillus alvei]MBG9746959.1 hypothetical protein [Paenibacillus alvei]MCY9581986.1 hypothetical protein [Paenibacillus alvei]MCY9585884.1 hypothetical protein [Paenibacillus alvei]
MRRNVYAQTSSGVNWIIAHADGTLEHTIHRAQGAPSCMTWKLGKPVNQYSAILISGYLHLLTSTDAGMFYTKCALNGQERHKVNIENYSCSGNPYIFCFGHTLYFGYTIESNGACSYVLKCLDQGVWSEKVFPFPGETETPLHTEQASFCVSENGTLYGLFHIRSKDNHNQSLLLMEVRIEEQEENWANIFSSSQPSLCWNMSMSVDRSGRPHLVWVVNNGGAATYYYANNFSFTKSCTPLKVSFSKEPVLPHIIVSEERVLLLFVTESSSELAYTYSVDDGASWVPFLHVGFAAGTRPRIVRGIRSSQRAIVPVTEVGIGYPHFRPLEPIDLLHPFFTMKAALPQDVQDDMLVRYARMQMDAVHHYLCNHVKALQQEVLALEERVKDEEYALQHADEQIAQLELEQQSMLDQLNSMHAEVEPSAIRLIQ